MLIIWCIIKSKEEKKKRNLFLIVYKRQGASSAGKTKIKPI